MHSRRSAAAAEAPARCLHDDPNHCFFHDLRHPLRPRWSALEPGIVVRNGQNCRPDLKLRPMPPEDLGRFTQSFAGGPHIVDQNRVIRPPILVPSCKEAPVRPLAKALGMEARIHLAAPSRGTAPSRLRIAPLLREPA